ncbi:acyl-CoA dehydrogenase [Thalassospira marina]|uniref:Acyl-CoA dehydrogenase n=1 Tax=Thalassospira marina TaxID=2048283 RepID=A0ABN5FFL1_9PROT|nr:acyl-CoA dehydrogenase [Thalassospira marina]AUG53315.1 acyl-CoA dehydrogenase [Thalassospira marina]
MTDYLPPIDDVRFILRHVIGLDGIAEIPAFADATPETIDAILDEAGKLAAGHLAPLNRTGDQQGSHLQSDGSVKTPDGWQDAYRHFQDGGWQGISASPNHGGMGLPLTIGAAVAEFWHSANMAFALCPMLTAGAIELLTTHGSPVQKDLYLTRLISGEWTGTMNLTEPQAGSDLAQVRSRAEPDGNGNWLVRGQKIFITYGDHDLTDNIVHLVLARTPDAPAGVKGISLFIVPKYLCNENGTLGQRNDVHVVSLEHKLGIHASPTAVLSFGDDKGAVGYMVGKEGNGLAAMFTMMNNARLAVGQQGIAIGERAYQQALDYARTRIQGRDTKTGAPAPILHHADIARMLLRMRASTEAARILALYAANQLDIAHHHGDAAIAANAQARADLLIPMVKAWSTDLGVENASLGIQVHGGMGFIEETGAAQHLRDARIAPIYEGTNGIQALDLIGRKLLRDQGAAAFALMDTITTDIADNAFEPSLGTAISQLKTCTKQILDTCTDDHNLAQTVASPYLRLFATICGGWLMARSQVALDTARGDYSSAFITRKQASITFYVTQILPECEMLHSQIHHCLQPAISGQPGNIIMEIETAFATD